jgi:hypothetical protein
LKFPKYFPQKILKKREKKNKLGKGLKENYILYPQNNLKRLAQIYI